MIYTTKDGDVVDAIIWSLYGTCNENMLDAVFAANKGLASFGAVLSAGLKINLPDLRDRICYPVNDVKIWQ